MAPSEGQEWKRRTTAGSGEHYTVGRRVENIGMTVGRNDIKY